MKDGLISFVSVNELGELLRSVKWGLSTFGLLVVLVDDEASQESVHGDTVHGHEKGRDGIGDNENDLS